MSQCTCHTTGCGNEGIAIEMDLTYTDPFDGQTYTMGCSCGVCGEPITDITDDTAPEPPELTHHDRP